jgi:alanyl-tRNA synthetase
MNVTSSCVYAFSGSPEHQLKELPVPGHTEFMPTQRAYYDYAGAEIFRAEIREVRPPAEKTGKTAVILDKTIFYPEGGGQSADRGTINGIPLADVREQGGEILHLAAEGGDQLVPGPAELALDVRRRRDFTVQHTGQHLLSGTILRMTGKPTVSMRLGEEFNTIDVDAPDLAAETLAVIEDAVMDAVEEDCPVIFHLCPPEDITAFPLRKVPPRGKM